MTGWVGDIEELTLANSTFRTVVFTGSQMKLTVMRIAPGEEIGVEMHHDRDQFIRLEAGTARVTFGPSKDDVSQAHDLEDDWAVVIPAGTWHNVVNAGDVDVKLELVVCPARTPRRHRASHQGRCRCRRGRLNGAGRGQPP